ncbi:glutaredoxin [Paenibacillus faecalis]|uniref:glutaredoxin n=1 Tax=Paenibacillus faecalis TaxID=2079532 RepID=UPI000D100A19|nr:glutaredoxin [Paenibacillus faecalis]
MSAKIEVFTDGSPYSESVVEQVNELSCSKCEITVYHLNEPDASGNCKDKVRTYAITSIPAVVLNGKLVEIEKLKKVK